MEFSLNLSNAMLQHVFLGENSRFDDPGVIDTAKRSLTYDIGFK